METGKTFAPISIRGRVINTDNTPESLTPVVYFGEKGESFNGRHVH